MRGVRARAQERRSPTSGEAPSTQGRSPWSRTLVFALATLRHYAHDPHVEHEARTLWRSLLAAVRSRPPVGR